MRIKNGFTLVELSIVLVIIGLLIGGILIGQSLISSVEKRRMFSELQQIDIMVQQYESKFRYLPGDAPNAYTLFGAACGTDSSASTSGACNGNGNGQVGQNYNNPDPGGWEPHGEAAKAWMHLRLAGFIKNNESPLDGGCNVNGGTGCRLRDTTNNYAYDDDNQFSFCIGHNAGIGGTYISTRPYNTHKWGITVSESTAVIDNVFYCSYSIQSSSGHSSFNAQDILEFDKKYDDGVANTGDIVVAGNDLVCVDNTAPANRGNYDLEADSENDCHLVYLGGRR